MGQALGCRQEADRRHVLGAALEKNVDRCDQGPPGGQHRVEHEHLAVVHVVRQPVRVDGCGERVLVPHQAEKSDLGGGHQLDHAVQHPQARAKNRNNQRLGFAELIAGGGRHGCGDGFWVNGQRSRRLVGDQGDEFLGEEPEGCRGRLLSAQAAHFVGDEWMIDHQSSHGMQSSRTADATVCLVPRSTHGHAGGDGGRHRRVGGLLA